MSDDIDWSKAPEGATHYNRRCFCKWLKNAAHPEFFDPDSGKWQTYNPPSVGRDHIAEAMPRPPISEGPLRVEEFDHLVEPDWSEAPEGTTHAAEDSAGRWRWFKINPTSHDTLHICTGEPMEGFPANLKLTPRPAMRGEPKPLPDAAIVFDQKDPDAAATVEFAQAMVRRLGQCRATGKSGWDDPEQCPPQRLAEGLVRAVRVGKLVDMGNYAMMLWKRAQMTGQEHRVRDWLDEARRSDAAQYLGEPVEWDGTGLPPVGLMVEVHYSDQAPYEALVVAEHLGEVVLWIGNGARTNYWRCDPAWLRPILTPEQRAAKERDEAVAAMLAVPEVFHDKQTMQALYDAGYRKTEGE